MSTQSKCRAAARSRAAAVEAVPAPWLTAENSMLAMVRPFCDDGRLPPHRVWNPESPQMRTFEAFREALRNMYADAKLDGEEPYAMWKEWKYNDLSEYWTDGMVTPKRGKTRAIYEEKVYDRFRWMAAVCRNAWQLMSPQPATTQVRCFQAVFDPAKARQRPTLVQWDTMTLGGPHTEVHPSLVQDTVIAQNRQFWADLQRLQLPADAKASAAVERTDLLSDQTDVPLDSTTASLSLGTSLDHSNSNSNSSSSSNNNSNNNNSSNNNSNNNNNNNNNNGGGDGMAIQGSDDEYDEDRPYDMDEESGMVVNPSKRQKATDTRHTGDGKAEESMGQNTFIAFAAPMPLRQTKSPVTLTRRTADNPKPSSSDLLAPGPMAAAAAAAPTPAAAATATPAATGYDLLSTGFGNVAASDQQAPLTPGLVDDFIRLTAAGYLNVRAKPTSTGPVEAPADTNEWIARLSSSGLGITLTNVAGTVDETTGKATVSGLDITLNFLGLAQPLVFSTAQCALAVTGQADVGDAILSDTALRKFKMLSLGLGPLGNDSSGAVPPGRDVSLAAVSLAFAPSWLQPLTTLFSLAAGTMLTVDDSAGARSMLTLSPDDRYTTWLRLAFRFHDEAAFKQQFKSMMGFLHADVEITSLRVVGRRTAMTVPRDNDTAAMEKRDIAIQAVFTVSSTVVIDVYVTFLQGATKLVLRFRSGPSAVPTALFSSRVLGDDVFDPSSMIPHSDNFSIAIRELSFTLSNPGSGGSASGGSTSFGITTAMARFELKLFGAPFTATIAGLPGQFAELGLELWTVFRPTWNPLMIAYLEDTDLCVPPRGADPQPISIATFIPGVRESDLPAGLKLNIARASLWMRRLADGSADVQFEGMIACDPNAKTGVPCVGIDYVSVAANCNRSSSGQAAWDFSLSTSVLLRPRSLADYDPMSLNLGATYTHATTTWVLTGGVVNLQFAVLYNLFDSDAQGPVMDVLEHISIPSLNVTLTFGPGQSSLLATGVLQIGGLGLDLLYSYTKEQDTAKQWRFQAQLGAVGTSTKLVDLLSSLDPNSTLLDQLHDVPFVRDIEFPAMADGAAASANPYNSTGDDTTLPDDAPVYFSVSQSDAGLTVWLKLAFDTPEGNVSLLFVQYVPAAPASAAGAPAGPAPAPKRLLRVSLDHLPQLPDIPVYGPVTQPVDALEYMLVHDGTTAAANAPLGFTRDEIADVNQVRASRPFFLFGAKWLTLLFLRIISLSPPRHRSCSETEESRVLLPAAARPRQTTSCSLATTS